MRSERFGFDRPDPLRRTLLASVAQAVRLERPYRNWRLTGLFPERVAVELARLPFAPPPMDAGSGRREMSNEHRHYFAGDLLTRHPVMGRVAEVFQTPQVASAFARSTGAKLHGTYLRIEYAVDQDGFWLEPHTDLGVKALSLLVQFASEGQAELGTDLYGGPGAWCERAAFGWNGALMFVPADNTWHGFEPRPIAGLRRSVIVNYVTDDWRARDQLAFPDKPLHLP